MKEKSGESTNRMEWESREEEMRETRERKHNLQKKREISERKLRKKVY